jgi:oligogalacturonide lyase
MIGKNYPSELKRYQDSVSGRTVTQLTQSASSYHLYFTDNSFTLGDKEIYYVSTKGSPDGQAYQFFRMDLSTGISMQVTEEPGGITGSFTKTPDSGMLVYVAGRQIKRLDTATGASRVVYEEPDPRVSMGAPFISPNKRFIGYAFNESGEHVKRMTGTNYGGFKETMFSIKKGGIRMIDMDTGEDSVVWEDTHWVGHFQFSPDDDTIATFCHEGPWNYVHQRIWILDTMKRSVTPCYRQQEDDSVGHEFWTRDGLIFFDNRGRGHDGTITSDRGQAVVQAPSEGEGQIPIIGFADKRGNILRTIQLPYYCNHYHANTSNTLLAGDEVDDLVLIDISGEKPAHSVLCRHSTSWRTQRAHPHPTFGWGDQKILFTSDRTGECCLYLIEL